MTIAILGYGKEGKAVENYFKKSNKDFKIFENFTSEELKNFDLAPYEDVFRSPSVKAISKDWNSVTKYFFDHCPCPIIGVTGTKGKGTTCTMITAILRGLEKKAFLVGNIGSPAIDILDEIHPNDVVIYEMSSFQLWDLKKSPKYAVVLRIEPDHLNVHDSFDDYLNAKSHIVAYQTTDDICVYFKNNENSVKIAEKTRAKKYSYPAKNKSKILSEILDSLRIPGDHNKENAEAALLVVSKYFNQDLETFLSNNKEKLIEIFSTFEGLPHRCQFLRELNNVLYYDDNFSAASPAMDVAIKTFHDHPTFLIAGGKDRGLDLTPHKTSIFKSNTVKKAILIGETKSLLAKNENPEKFEFAESLKDAVDRAKKLAENYQLNHPNQEKPIVLMSPGAASFDMFKNFEDRGTQYQNLVYGLGEK